MTLMELLIGLAISAVLLMSMVNMLASANAAGSVGRQQLDLQARAQFAVQRIGIQIDASGNAVLADKADSRTSSPWPLAATYTWTPADGLLTEKIGAVSRVIAEEVSDFSITSPSVAAGETLITVSLTLAAGGGVATAGLQARMGGAR